ncbi:hypothetical protein Tco_1313132 [Tanacetum coccineum]
MLHTTLKREGCVMPTSMSQIQRYRSTALETSIRPLKAQKMVPKKTTTPMIDAAIKQLIAQGIADALAEYEATRNSGNGDDNHDSGSGRKTKRY